MNNQENNGTSMNEVNSIQFYINEDGRRVAKTIEYVYPSEKEDDCKEEYEDEYDSYTYMDEQEMLPSNYFNE